MTTADFVRFTILELEGGDTFTDDPDDLGGATKFGITLDLLSEFLGRPATKDEVKELTLPVAVQVTSEMFLRRNRLDQISDWRIRFVTFDFCFNAGDDDGIPALQRALGVTPDGVIGKQTIDAAALASPGLIVGRIMAARMRFHVNRTKKRASQIKWLGGWINRCAAVLELVTK